jgi:GTP-binding protein
MSHLPIIAILGRPNVGKSTLFNRLVGKKIALVDDQPGVTRDRRYADGSLVDLKFRIVDTAGMEEVAPTKLEARMLAQSRAAITEADVLLFVIDARAGVTPDDEHFAQMLRQSGKPVILVVNKAEGKAAQAVMGDVYALGFDRIAMISAEHGEGMAELFETLLTSWDWPEPEVKSKKKSKKQEVTLSADETDEEALARLEAQEPENTGPLRMVILGRPNAGKSTLVNSMIGQDRLLTGPEAGITRDAITVRFEHALGTVEVVDTAGMRKRANIQDKVEKLAVSDAVRAMTFAEVVVLLLDATAPLEKQDATLAALVEREGRACIIGLNKWDLITKGKTQLLDEINYLLGKHVSQMGGITVVPLSAKDGKGIEELLGACFNARKTWSQRIGTAALNRWLEGVITHHSPPLVRGRRLKIKYITQVKSRPPTFHLFCNMAEEFPDAYLKYFVHGLRDTFNMPGTPIRLILKASNNPFDKNKKKK